MEFRSARIANMEYLGMQQYITLDKKEFNFLKKSLMIQLHRILI